MTNGRPKVSVIIGTRPEAIKLSPVVLEFEADGAFDVEVCLTAQHREMLDSVINTFGLRPSHDLNLMQPGQTLAEFTARASLELDKYLLASKPDLVLVEGDTTTVFASALVAFYHHIALGHVEAGLRTWDMKAPWPEEANRVLTSRLTRLHFAPTEGSKRNLLEERVPEDRIFVTGNTVIDALSIAVQKVEAHPPKMPAELEPIVNGNGGARKLVLITGHRRENFGEGLDHICDAIAELAEKFPDVFFVYPVHLNPKVREPVNRKLNRGRSDNIILCAPLPYLEFVALMRRSTLILTDSGGIQEEAPSLGKPVLVMRDATERPEGIAAGNEQLVGTDRARIVERVSALLQDEAFYRLMAEPHHLFGDGKASRRIVQHCKAFLKSNEAS